MKKFRRSIQILWILAFISLGTSTTIASEITKVISKNEALDLLINKIEQDSLYSSWTKNECLLFSTEETTNKYFQFAVSEKHGDTCPGDPETHPIIDRFQVIRSTKEVLWYDITQDEYVSYKYLLKLKYPKE